MVVDTQGKRETQERLVCAACVVGSEDHGAAEHGGGEDPSDEVDDLFPWVDATLFSHASSIVHSRVVQQHEENEKPEPFLRQSLLCLVVQSFITDCQDRLHVFLTQGYIL